MEKTAIGELLLTEDEGRVMGVVEGGEGAAGSNCGLLENSSNVKPITEALNSGFCGALF